MAERKILTTESGAPVADNQNSQTAGPDGPVATPVPVQDSSLMAPLARAGCLVIREPRAPAAPAGSPCVILKLAL